MLHQRPLDDLPRSKWKARLRLFSIAQSDRKHEKDMPLLSNSPLSTPASSPPHLQRDLKSDAFLTPLEVHDDDYFIPLTHQKGVMVGDMILPPPPPPQRKLLHGENKVREPFAGSSAAARKTRAFSDGALMSMTCFICQEHLEAKLDLEKLISLQCGDCVHEECLQTVVEYNVSRVLADGDYSSLYDIPRLRNLIFPKCRGQCCASARRSASVCPIDSELVESIVFDSVLALKLAKVNRGETSPPQLAKPFYSSHSKPDYSSHTKPDYRSHTKPEHQSFSQPEYQSFSKQQNRSFPDPDHRSHFSLQQSRPDSKYFFKADQTLRPKSIFSDLQLRNISLDFYYNSRPVSLAPSSITQATASVRIAEHDRIPLEKLKNTFIKHMLDTSGIDLSMLVALGPLRLVDQLLVSANGSEYHIWQVYLFANYLVLWQTGLPLLLSLTDTLSITTPEYCVIEIRLSSHPAKVVRLYSEIGSIIEKWGIALSDPAIIIPSEIFTSTLSVLDLDSNAASGHTFGKQISPIAETSVLGSPVDSEPRSDFLRSSSIAEHLVRLSVSSELSFLPQISPLRIKRNIATTEGYSDSDSDSDEELISAVMSKAHNT